jgi:hypothetical protein
MEKTLFPLYMYHQMGWTVNSFTCTCI